MTKPEQLPFDLGPRYAYEREDFWVSACNHDAVAWLDKWPDWSAPALILFGPPASGKTHMLQAWKKMSAAKEIPATDILSQPAYDLLGLAKTVVIDNIQSLIGNRVAEEALFHLYNMLLERKGHILITAETSPQEWNFILPDLKSRLLAAPAVAIGSPDDQLMAIVLTKLFSDRQIFVSQEVVQFIIPRIERSFLALRQITDKIDHKALSEKRAVTVPLVRELLYAAPNPP